jgi:hypothetical protein
MSVNWPAIENIRAKGEAELEQESTDSSLTSAIHSSTLFQLELGSQIRMLKSMRLNAPFDELIPNITAFYERKVALWKQMSDISSAFLAGPQPGVDYGKLAAQVPQIRAQLDYIDQALFEATPSIFGTLIDLKADSKGHASHLIITKAEREKLIGDLTSDFGSRLDRKGQNYTVSAAQVLKTYLLKDYKCSDEPWE